MEHPNIEPAANEIPPIGPETEDRNVGINKSRLLRLRTDECRPRGDNLREWGTEANKAKVRQYAQSILEGGIRNPITVSKLGDEWIIEDGETRWRAVRLLEGWDEFEQKAVQAKVEPGFIKIRAQITEATANEVDRLTDLYVRQTGRDFSDYEKAQGIKRYIRYGRQQSEIADKIGLTQSQVSVLHTLTQAPQSLQDLVRDEKASATTVVNMFRNLGGTRVPDPIALWGDVETQILEYIEIARKQAGAEYDAAMLDAKHWNDEAQRLAGTPEGNEPIHQQKSRMGRKPPTKRDRALRNFAHATERADRARRVQEQGPDKITTEDIRAATAKSPDASPPKMTRTIYDALLDRVRFEAAWSPHSTTRDRCNETLTKYGFEAVTARVDDDGNELEVAEPAAAEPVTAAENAETIVTGPIAEAVTGSTTEVPPAQPPVQEGNIAA